MPGNTHPRRAVPYGRAIDLTPFFKCDDGPSCLKEIES